MNPLNRTEAIGIFVSVGIMAVALSILRFGTDTFSLAVPESETQVATVVSTREKAADERDLEDSLVNVTDTQSTLTRLIIDDVRLGNGASVKEGDTLVAHYIGATQDGTRFDSSYERGEPFVFTVGKGQVIEGWERGLIGMKVGGQRVLVIPGDLAYGNMQVGIIPPNATLVFAVELLEIR